MVSGFEREYKAINLVTAVNETSAGLPHERISVIRLDTSVGSVRDSVTKIDIRGLFVPNDRETEVNLRMIEDLNKDPDRKIGLWLSPPNILNPNTGKILVADRITPWLIIQYDITGEWFGVKDFREFSDKLATYDKGGYFLLEKDGFDVLREIIPMPGAWEKILDGTAEIKFNRDVQTVIGLEQKYSNGRLIDEVDRSFGANVRAACGGSNSQESFLINKMMDINGQESHYVKNCGQCGVVIEGYISKGYVCSSCHGVYEGC